MRTFEGMFASTNVSVWRIIVQAAAGEVTMLGLQKLPIKDPAET